MEIDSSADVKTVATIANQISYQNKGANRGRGLSAYTIVGGWDARRGAQVYACTAGGNMVKERWTTDGSGSTYIWGFLDDGWREGMTREACEALVTRAIALAMSVDGSSGGCVRLNTVNREGIFEPLFKGATCHRCSESCRRRTDDRRSRVTVIRVNLGASCCKKYPNRFASRGETEQTQRAVNRHSDARRARARTLSTARVA